MFNQVLFIMLLAFSSLTHAFSVDWIVYHTNGKVSQPTAKKIVSAVHKYSFKHGVDPEIIFKIMQTESTYNPNAKAKTSNATGLMQVIPRWHQDKIKGRNLKDINVNIEVGIKVYKEYLDRSKGSAMKALWRYNGGKAKKQYAQKVLNTKEKPIQYAKLKRINQKVTLVANACSNKSAECRVQRS